MPTIPGVVGSDNIPPIYQPEARWCWWSIEEIWRGQLGENKYIPKVKDYVIDPDTYTTYMVVALDPVTYIPTLEVKKPGNMDFPIPKEDVLLGVGPGTQSDTYRVYLKTTTIPFTLAVDERLGIGGSRSAYCKIFRGSTVDGTGEVISKMYDSNGLFISENVPLELATIDSHTNVAWRTVAVCNCTVEMEDEEIVTAVFYTNDGVVISKRQLLVENTNFIRSLNISSKYVTGISMKCPFMSPTFDHQIDYPLNVPMDALNMMGTVAYSDGTTLDLPVDGTKFSMFGLDQYVSTIVGQQVNLVLRYALGTNEKAVAGVGVNGNYITEPYKIVTVNPNNSYTVKLFGYPYWVSDAVGYQIRWWLLNLDRNIWFDVTDKVIWNANTGPFDPKGYGYLQRKSVSINLKQVSGAYKSFVHTQAYEVVLGVPDGFNSPWQVSHEASATRPMYGQGLFADRKQNGQIVMVNLSSGITDANEWIQRVYKNTFPLVNPDLSVETAPVNPTDFYLEYGGISVSYPITQWNQDLVVPNGVVAGKTVSIRFVKQTGVTELQLSVAAMIVNN